MGSQTLFVMESLRSQTMKTIQQVPDSTKEAMTPALFQGYSTPACSKAKTSRMEATSEVSAPK
jgi:hypothetical protein